MLRRALLISSNNYIDRDGEIVSKQALADYVNKCYDNEGRYIGKSVMLMWHDGDPIGAIIGVDLSHGFLTEIAEELPDAPVNIGTSDNPIMTTIKACWDMIEAKQDELGVSQGFLYNPATQQDGVYTEIIKFESSILPIEMASNPFTYVKMLP